MTERLNLVSLSQLFIWINFKGTSPDLNIFSGTRKTWLSMGSILISDVVVDTTALNLIQNLGLSALAVWPRPFQVEITTGPFK